MPRPIAAPFRLLGSFVWGCSLKAVNSVPSGPGDRLSRLEGPASKWITEMARMDVQGYATAQQRFAFPDLVSLDLLFVTSGTVTMNGVPAEFQSLVYSASDGSIITLTGTGVRTDGPA